GGTAGPAAWRSAHVEGRHRQEKGRERGCRGRSRAGRRRWPACDPDPRRSRRRPRTADRPDRTGPADRPREARRRVARVAPDARRSPQAAGVRSVTEVISTAADPQRAAVLVMLLAEEDATGLLSRLSPEELRLLGSKMCELGEIGPGAIADAIAGFAERADQAGLPAQDRAQDVRRLMTGAVGELKADNLMRGIAPEEARKPATSLDLARWLDPEVIVSLIADEHPQAIAVLLVQLDPQVAAQVLAGLPENKQTPVVHRIARLGPIAPQAIT